MAAESLHHMRLFVSYTPFVAVLCWLLHRLVVVLWLFWETYFATVGATVKVTNWVGAVLQKWQHNRKWGARAGVSKSRQ
jgi:hypothetical protein